jgi:uncharacterized membrane protein
VIDKDRKEKHMFMGFGAIFFILIIGALVYVLSSLRPNGGATSGRSEPTSASALNILQARYARGEISKAKYEEMREDLRV